MLSVCLCVVCMSMYCLCVVCMYVYVFRKADNNYPPPPQLSLFNITKRENSPPLVPQDRQRDQTRHIRPPSMTCQPPPTSVSGQPETTTQKYTHRSPHRNTPTGHHTEIHPHVTTQKYTHTSPHRNTPTPHHTEMHHMSQDRNTPHVTRSPELRNTPRHKTEIHYMSQDRNTPHTQDHPSLETHPQVRRPPKLRNTHTGHKTTQV